jgi:hypothetical protein
MPGLMNVKINLDATFFPVALYVPKTVEIPATRLKSFKFNIHTAELKKCP